jgi:hypothetical protein
MGCTNFEIGLSNISSDTKVENNVIIVCITDINIWKATLPKKSQDPFLHRFHISNTISSSEVHEVTKRPKRVPPEVEGEQLYLS